MGPFSRSCGETGESFLGVIGGVTYMYRGYFE